MVNGPHLKLKGFGIAGSWGSAVGFHEIQSLIPATSEDTQGFRVDRSVIAAMAGNLAEKKAKKQYFHPMQALSARNNAKPVILINHKSDKRQDMWTFPFYSLVKFLIPHASTFIKAPLFFTNHHQSVSAPVNQEAHPTATKHP